MCVQTASLPVADAHGLLERDDLLVALGEAFGNAAAGRGRLVFVAGEAGAGKTVLMRHFCEAQERSARILWGACEALFTPRPLGPILDIAQVTGGELARLAQGDAIPYQVAAGLTSELREQEPTVLVLEDLHWADEATLDVLRLVAHRIETVPVLVVATYRADSLGPTHLLTTVLGDLTTAQAVQRMRLLPLSLEAVATLAEPYGFDSYELHHVTGGNPFFVTEVLAAGEEEIPETVRDAVLARASRVSPQARALLEAIAIVPPSAELWLLEALEDGADNRLDECLASGMLTEAAGTISYRHELARLAVESSVPAGRKAALHKRALTALRSPPYGAADLSRLAHHAAAAGDGEAVLELAPRAADRASSVGAHREAAALYGQALEFSATMEPRALAELLQRRSHECYLTDQPNEAIEALEGAVDCYRKLGDSYNEGDKLRSLSTILWCPGRAADAKRVGVQAVEVLERLPPGPALANAYVNLSFLCRKAFQLEEARDWGYRALELAERSDDAGVLIGTQITLGRLEAMADLDAGRRQLERALERAEHEGLEELVAEALLGLADTSARHRSYGPAEAYSQRGLEYCSEHGIDISALYFVALRARMQLDGGNLQDATESAAFVLRERAVSTFPRTVALVVLALVRARRGDPGIEPLLDEALELAKPTGELPRILPVAAARAEVGWLRGDFRAGAEATEAALDLALQRHDALAIGELRSWRRRCGIQELSEPVVEEPYASELAGDWEGAAALWQERSCPYEAAVALASSDDVDALRRALDAMHELGARGAAVVIARRLRERGVHGLARGPRPATRENAAWLTARELDVLHLLAEGSRNATIAERLFLSPRTVDHHVSAILRKLHVASRGAAVAEARRLGIVAGNA